jgi:hypothetical protein
VNGIFSPGPLTSIVFGAIECRPRRRRQGATKRNYKTLVMACGKYDQSLDTSVPPYVLPCPSSGYAEAKTGRFGIPVSMTQWGASSVLVGFVVESGVHMRIDAFDGTTVRGAIYGVFDQPITGEASAVPAPIGGEVHFEFPFEIQ